MQANVLQTIVALLVLLLFSVGFNFYLLYKLTQFNALMEFIYGEAKRKGKAVNDKEYYHLYKYVTGRKP